MTPSEPSPASRPPGDRARYLNFDPGTGGQDPNLPVDPPIRPCQQWRFWDEYRTVQDERVCPVCGPLHGRRFVRGTGPQPPLHPGCRCSRVEVWAECISRPDPAARTPGGGGRPKK
ncbi:MAG: hypothetical protein QJR03_10020 [Sphaerobacter sp.]|nr:hypothetical protein [Sphaerobacter sp.]